ncbi:cupredoxin domain-containing protein [Candidatus Micrarchaeota archaeon]|nr:cupredoxin domain-containing protein [Candidatus Micrarchaeota archaeon]
MEKLTLLALVGIIAITAAALVGFNAMFPTTNSAAEGGQNMNLQGTIQDVYLKARADGTYDKNEIRVKAGVPVRLHFSTEPRTGCGQELVVRGLNVRVLGYPDRDSVAEFTPDAPGRYSYSCGMGMWEPGAIVVEK